MDCEGGDLKTLRGGRGGEMQGEEEYLASCGGCCEDWVVGEEF